MIYHTSPSRQSWHMVSVGVAGAFLQKEHVPPTSVFNRSRNQDKNARISRDMPSCYSAPPNLSTKENNHA